MNTPLTDKQIEELIDEVRASRRVIAFYADRSNWIDSGFDYGNGKIRLDDKDDPRNDILSEDTIISGGKRAREHLKRFGRGEL